MPLLQWISDHKELLFDGFGGALFIAIVGWAVTALFSKSTKTIKQKQKGGIGSHNTQIGSIEHKSDE